MSYQRNLVGSNINAILNCTRKLFSRHNKQHATMVHTMQHKLTNIGSAILPKVNLYILHNNHNTSPQKYTYYRLKVDCMRFLYQWGTSCGFFENLMMTNLAT
jgi:hypothetical protein